MRGAVRRGNAIVALGVAALIGGGCAARAPQTHARSEVATPRPSGSQEPGARPEPIGLTEGPGHLPKEGVVVGRHGDLLFLTTEGDVIGSLGNVRLYYEWTVPGPVVVRRGGKFFSMNVDRGVLQPLTKDDASDASTAVRTGARPPDAA